MNISDLKAGDDVAILDSSKRFIVDLKVLRITPTGQISVGRDGGKTLHRFGKDGREIASGSCYRRAQIITDVAYAKEQQQKQLALGEAMRAIMAIEDNKRLQISNSAKREMQEYMQRLQALCDAANSAINAIPD